MTITISDPGLLAELSRVSERVDVLDTKGAVIGTFSAEGRGKLPPGVKSPFTEEQLAELRKQRGGRPLADILRDLEARK